MTIDLFKNWYNSLKPAEKRLLGMLIIVGLISGYFNFFFKPTVQQVDRFKQEKKESREHLQMLMLQYPDVGQAKETVSELEADVEEMALKVKNIESALINETQVPQLLTELIKCAQVLDVGLESVKQETFEDRNGFLRLYIEIRFASAYSTAVKYLEKIEKISPFLKIDEMEVVQSRDNPVKIVQGFIKLNTILKYATEEEGYFFSASGEPLEAEEKYERNPFSPKFAAKKIRRKDLRLSGITYRAKGDGSSAIINGALVRIGDRFGEEVVVEEILPGSVVVNDGIESYALYLD